MYDVCGVNVVAKPTSSSPTRSKSGSVSGKSQGTNDSSTGVTAEKPPPHAKEKKGCFLC